MPPIATSRGPKLVLVPLRIFLLTFLFTLLSFAAGLLVGIVSLLIATGVRGHTARLTIAYRDVALPAALVVGACALVTSTVMEMRHYRQAKGLSEIERTSS